VRYEPGRINWWSVGPFQPGPRSKTSLYIGSCNCSQFT